VSVVHPVVVVLAVSIGKVSVDTGP